MAPHPTTAAATAATAGARRAAEADIVARVRDARFAHGLVCPRCGGGRICRWGMFSGRQRYRCGVCLRTFSDLTATPFAYTKRLHRWPDFIHLLHDAATVRQCAHRLHVQVSTAFRWRHAFLDHLRAERRPILAATVELTELLFLRSYKGQRGLGEYARARGEMRYSAWRVGCPLTRVILLRSRSGDVASGNLDRHHVLPGPVRAFLHQHVAPGSTIVSRFGRLHPYGSGARSGGYELRVVRPSERDPLRHVTNVQCYSRRLATWVLRFRGVATRYLDNYLAWHRHADGSSADGRVAWWMARLRPAGVRAPP